MLFIQNTTLNLTESLTVGDKMPLVKGVAVLKFRGDIATALYLGVLGQGQSAIWPPLF